MGVFRSQHVDGESARCGVGGALDVESTRMPLHVFGKVLDLIARKLPVATGSTGVGLGHRMSD